MIEKCSSRLVVLGWLPKAPYIGGGGASAAPFMEDETEFTTWYGGNR